MDPIHGCFGEGPLLIFSTSRKDFGDCFWSYARNFGFPELGGNLVQDVVSLMDTDRNRGHLLLKILEGAEMVLKKEHFLCRVHRDLVSNPERTKQFVSQILADHEMGRGYFHHDFLPLNYKVDLHSLKVNSFDVQQAPPAYKQFMSSQIYRGLEDYSAVLDICYDVTIQLLKPIPPLTLDRVGKPFIFEPDDISAYRAIVCYLKNSNEVWLDPRSNLCRRRPQSEEENDAFFKNRLFVENPLNLYILVRLICNFSNDHQHAETMASFPMFKRTGPFNDIYEFVHVESPLDKVPAQVHEGVIHMAFSGTADQIQARTWLKGILDFLKKNKDGFRGDYVRSARFGINDIHIRMMNRPSRNLKQNQEEESLVQESRQRFYREIEKLSDIFKIAFDKVCRMKSLDMHQELWDMVSEAVKLDPVSYMDNEVKAIREYSHSIVNGNF